MAGTRGGIWGEIPEDERSDLINAYNKRLFSGKRAEEVRFAKAWSAWENALATVQSNGQGGDSPADYARAFARLENHYFLNNGFLGQDGYIYENMDKITHIPGIIVQGRYDMICPPDAAYRLSKLWPKADLRINPVAGHALSAPGISAELVKEMDRLAIAAVADSPRPAYIHINSGALGSTPDVPPEI